MADRKKIKDLSTSRGQVIQALLDKLENKVQAAQRGLLKLVLEDFLDGMETDEAGNIKNTLANKRRFSMFDTVFNRYIKDKGLEVVKTIAEGVGRVADFNQQYFSVLDRNALLAPIHDNVRETLGAWLGLNSRGNVAPNGYLDTLLKDSSVKNTIKNIALKGVLSQNGYNDLKKTLALHIEGNQEQTGALQRYYRNFAYDTYSITDRTAAKIYADKLKFNFAIYEGGLIETSREFCEEHNGKVFTREEIGKMKPTKAIPPGYDPFTDMGGYGCRHHWNWVPDAVAFSMRPELKNMTPGKEEDAPAKPEPAKPELAKPETGARNFDPAKPFDQIPEFKAETWKLTDDAKKAMQGYGAAMSRREKHDAEVQALNVEVTALNKKASKIPWDDAEAHAELSKEIEAMWGALIAKRTERDATKAELEKHSQAFREELTKGKAAGTVTVTVNSPSFRKDKAFQTRLKKALDFYRVASRGYVDDRTIQVNSGAKRAFMSGGNIHLNKDTTEKTMVHEMGHVLEYNNHVIKAAVEFLERRTAGQPTRRLSEISRGYSRHEVYKKGDFYNPYVGKIYTGTRYRGYEFTEVISMGLDRMFTDPIGFRNDDLDHFNLIYSLFFKD